MRYAFAILLLSGLLLSGCGKKNAPYPPDDEPTSYPKTYPTY